jgi:hypothetical protein
VVCILDDTPRPEFTWLLGEGYRGFLRQVRRYGSGCTRWPTDVLAQAWSEDDGWQYDSVIYLSNTACMSCVGAVITLAYELECLRQYSKLIRACRGAEHSQELRSTILPNEQDARLASKRIAEEIFGKSNVKAYATAQVEDATAQIQDYGLLFAWQYVIPRWQYFIGLDTEQAQNS